MSITTPLPSATLGWTDFFTREWLSHQREGKGLRPARIIEDLGSEYTLRDDSGERRAKLNGALLATLTDERRPTVGDWVLFDPDLGRLVRIEHALARATVLTRKAAGETSAGQTIAANVDVAFIVAALSAPEHGVHTQRRSLNARRIERTLRASATAAIRGVVVINKADLDPEAAALTRALQNTLPRTDVVLLSAHTGHGIAALTAHLGAGETAVLVGASGVGKSSLMNRLLGHDAQRVFDTRAADARGRHTTTARRLFALPSGGMLIDTPGMRELGLWASEETELSELGQTDVDRLSSECRFHDCTHTNEPDCAVQQAIQDGRIEPERLEHAQQLHRELERQRERHDALARHKARTEQRAFSKRVRDRLRLRDKGS